MNARHVVPDRSVRATARAARRPLAPLPRHARRPGLPWRRRLAVATAVAVALIGVAPSLETTAPSLLGARTDRIENGTSRSGERTPLGDDPVLEAGALPDGPDLLGTLLGGDEKGREDAPAEEEQTPADEEAADAGEDEAEPADPGAGAADAGSAADAGGVGADGADAGGSGGAGTGGSGTGGSTGGSGTGGGPTAPLAPQVPPPSPSPSPSPTPAPSPTPSPSPAPSPGPTPRPTPTPAPTPAPTPTPPAPVPTPPSTPPGSVGVPPTAQLRVIHDDVTITQPGFVLENVDVRGYVRVQAPGVVIRNSVVRGRPGLTGSMALIQNGTQGNHLTVEDTTLAAQHPSRWVDGIQGKDFTLRRVDIHGVVDSVKITGDHVLVEDSWLHDNLYYATGGSASRPDTHNDNVQIQQGSDITIRNSVLSGTRYAGLQITQDAGPVSDVTFTGNRAGGGACTVNVDDRRGAVRGLAITGNTFTGGQLRADCGISLQDATRAVATVRGNVWSDGRPVEVTRG